MSPVSPLAREEVRSVIEGRSTASRVPVVLKFWVHPEEFGDREAQVHEILNQYTEDVQSIPLTWPETFTAPADAPDYRWVNWDDPYDDDVPHDSRIALHSWDQLDDVLAHFPDGQYPGMTAGLNEDYPEDGRYRMAFWWYGLFERMWSFRGMTNALMDFYDHPDEVHRLFRAMTDFYKTAMVRARRELNADAIMMSDDIGTQSNTFFSLAIFREFFKPYYKEIFDTAHELGMHFWLHTCGNIESFLPEFIEIGLDVLHPVQKYAMDQLTIPKQYGDQIAFWVGLDVQQVIPWGTPHEVRTEVCALMDAGWRLGEGRMIFSAGNGVNGDCTLASLEALFDEAYRHGAQVVASAEMINSGSFKTDLGS